MGTALRGKVAIAAVGYEAISARRGDEKISGTQIQARAVARAMRESGLKRSDIGALYTGRPPMENTDPQWNMILLDALKMAPRITTSITTHGSGYVAALRHAAMAIHTGEVDYALCVSGSAGPLWLDAIVAASMYESDPQFEMPYFPLTPSLYAQWAARYAWENRITPEQAAKVAVESRKWALHHPLAVGYREGPLTIEEVVHSRMISTPFRLLDCARWYPGGVGIALILTSAERAKDMTDKPIFIQGMGECTTHESVTQRLMVKGVEPAMDGPNLTVSGLKVAADDAYRMAGWTAKDLDVVETQSPFTYTILMALEEIGLCPKGEAGRFVESGGIDFDGGIPVNTNGGMLSYGQPLNTNPLLLEVIQQLRGEALGKQVPDAQRALVHFHGGTNSSHAVALLSNQE